MRERKRQRMNRIEAAGNAFWKASWIGVSCELLLQANYSSSLITSYAANVQPKPEGEASTITPNASTK